MTSAAWTPTSAFSVRQMCFVAIGSEAPDLNQTTATTKSKSKASRTSLTDKSQHSKGAKSKKAPVKQSPGIVKAGGPGVVSRRSLVAVESQSVIQPPLLTARADVTVLQLIEVGILQPGGIVSVTFQNQTMKGILQPDASIQHSGQSLASCKEFATVVKQGIDPSHGEDNGWESCMHNGKPLEEYRSKYLAMQAAQVGDGALPDTAVA